MANVKQLKCKLCGGPLEFDPGQQKLVCPYCGTAFELSDFPEEEEPAAAEAAEAKPAEAPQAAAAEIQGTDTPAAAEAEGDAEAPGEEGFSGDWNTDAGTAWGAGEEENMRVWSCPSCGGEIIGDANTAAMNCPYCGNPTVMSGQLSGSLRPDIVIPFQVSKEEAKKAFEKNLEGKTFLPRIFRDRHHIDEIKGIYVPYWLFSGNAHGDIDYDATRVRVWSDSQNQYTETSYFDVNRFGTVGFENIPADGSSKIADDLMESIEPFDYSKAKPFSTAYFAGYCADKYDVKADDVIGHVQDRVIATVTSAFRNSVDGYDAVTARRSSIRLKDNSVKYALLPVWLLTTSWNGEPYVFAMNGQSGRFVGDLPVDKQIYKSWFWKRVIPGTVILTVVLWLLSWLS